MELIPGLPNELGSECLTRSHHSSLPAAFRVCRRWRELLDSPDFHYNRSQKGRTQKIACLLQSIPPPVQPQTAKYAGSLSYGLTLFDPVNRSWERLSPVPKYPHGLPLFCRLASSEGKLIVMGGWDPVSYEPVGEVFVYDFTAQKWRQGKDMPSKRSFFGIGAIHGRVYIAGGHDENKCALKSAWSYDVREDEWTELTQMSQERDECEGLIIGDDFWIVSGYGNEKQGLFEASAESYQMSTGQWRRVEGAWKPGRCPRSCAGLGEDGKLASWIQSELPVGVGVFGVGFGGGRALVIGSAFPGTSQGFFMVEGQNGRVKMLDVPHEFSGFVQSGCCIEI